jgi:16S rRNA (uracil1498-N3)-methyltransferase
VFVDDLAVPAPAPEDLHHLARVLRLHDGEAVVAADGCGGWRMCEFARGGPGDRSGGAHRVVAAGPVRAESPPVSPLGVAFAPAKGDRPEWVVQKLTELGIDRIVVLATPRTIVRWEGDRAARAMARLRRVSVEAAAQCRRVWLPDLVGPVPLAELARAHAASGDLALAQHGGAAVDAACRMVAVGPEGGWDPEELALGLPAVGLGRNVLRAETAAVVAGAALTFVHDGPIHDGPIHDGPVPTGPIPTGPIHDAPAGPQVPAGDPTAYKFR